MKMRLPGDLKRYAIFAVLKRVALCFVLLVTVSVLLYFYGNMIFPVKDLAMRGMLYAFALVLPFVITGVPFKLFDSSFRGRIINVDIKEGVGTTRESDPRIFGSIDVILTIEKNNGKIVFEKIRERTYSMGANHMAVSDGRKNEHFCENYKVGDEVFHLYGSKHFVILSMNTEDKVKCAVCGALNNCTNDACRDCGYTLIKFKDQYK